MLKKITLHAAAILFILTISSSLQAQSNMYYALSLGTYYSALPSEGYTADENYSGEFYEVPAKPAIAEFENTQGEQRATAVRLNDRTEFTVHERRHYKRLAVEESVYELRADPTPTVSSINKVMIAPHGYVTYNREFTENYVMPDFRTDVWLEKPYLLGSKMQIIKDNALTDAYDDVAND